MNVFGECYKGLLINLGEWLFWGYYYRKPHKVGNRISTLRMETLLHMILGLEGAGFRV